MRTMFSQPLLQLFCPRSLSFAKLRNRKRLSDRGTIFLLIYRFQRSIPAVLLFVAIYSQPNQFAVQIIRIFSNREIRAGSTRRRGDLTRKNDSTVCCRDNENLSGPTSVENGGEKKARKIRTYKRQLYVSHNHIVYM